MSNVIGDVESAPQTFSSWDSCMTKAYCKWPAIIGIVIASLIVLSIVSCFVRCLCCGASCCCSCFRCCGCFESCTRPRGRSEPRYKDEYTPVQNQQPMPYQGYQAPMMYQANQPQFATFDASSKRIHEDSLPAMPSWDTAQTRRVENDTQDMEMKDLEHQASAGQSQRLSRTARMYAPVDNEQISPVHSPYHEPQNDYMHGAAQPYGSDLGAQRLNQNPYSHADASYNRAPLSPAPTYSSGPAPTYHTQQPQPPMNSNASYESDRFASPPPSGGWSPVESTRYEPTEYTPQSNYHNVPISPVQQQQQQQQQQQRQPPFQSFGVHGQGRPESFGPPAGQARPPSFLQVGRKPVSGSVREL